MSQNFNERPQEPPLPRYYETAQEPAKKKLCIYHGNCADGFGAAYAVWKKFGDEVEFHPGVYQNAPPDVTGRDVILVDFSYKRPALEEMAKTARTITILDHHKSAAEDLETFAITGRADLLLSFEEFAEIADGTEDAPWNIRALFDMERSGAMIAWHYFHPATPPPKLIEHIQDRDLWHFRLPGTRNIQAALFSYHYDFEIWDNLMGGSIEGLMHDGEAIERKHFKDIAELLKVVTVRMTIGGHDVPVANLPYTMTSDAGLQLAQGEKFAACYWDTPEGRVFSLRSTDEGMDVSEIAKQYGGGGHAHASGFRLAPGAAL